MNFFSLAVGISLFTYFANGDYSISNYIPNFTDLILVISVSIAILIWGDTSTRFKRFTMGCLVAVVGIISFWVITNNHVLMNYSVQNIVRLSTEPGTGITFPS